MLDQTERRTAASALLDAIQTGIAVTPLSMSLPRADVSDAYAISRIVNDALVDRGDRVCGHKIGLTSKAMQELAGIDEPDYGYLRDSMFVDEGGSIARQSLFRPLIEAELAFVLARDLEGPGVTMEDVVAATEAVVPCLEIVDMRYASGGGLVDTIADNASSGYVVLGGTRAAVSEFDLENLGVVVRRNGESVVSGSSGEVMGNPLLAVAWLANKLTALGTQLEAGQTILSGSFVRAFPVEAGETVEAEFDYLGSVSVALTS